MLLYVTFALCGLGAAALVYRYDLYDREPIPAAALAVALGAATMALADPLERLVFAYLRTESAAGLAAVAALVEEGSKLLVVVAFAVFARRVFNDPMDGLIYGSLAGLGAALEEGVAVLRGGPGSGLLLPPDELVRLTGHLVMGGVGGFGVGRWLTRPAGNPAGGVAGNPPVRPLARELATSVAVGSSFVAAASMHFGWDLLALRVDPFREGAPREALLGAALMLAGFALYGRLVVVASRWSQRVFAPTAARSLVGWPWRKRRS